MPATTLDLFRSIHKQTLGFERGVYTSAAKTEPKVGVLYPDFYERDLGKGKKRDPDVTLTLEEGVEWVEPGGGTSLFDKENAIPGSFHQFLIPVGTEYSDELLVLFTGYNKRFKANHYQIEVKKKMRIDTFKGYLDNFARAAVAKQCELAK